MKIETDLQMGICWVPKQEPGRLTGRQMETRPYMGIRPLQPMRPQMETLPERKHHPECKPSPPMEICPENQQEPKGGFWSRVANFQEIALRVLKEVFKYSSKALVKIKDVRRNIGN